MSEKQPEPPKKQKPSVRIKNNKKWIISQELAIDCQLTKTIDTYFLNAWLPFLCSFQENLVHRSKIKLSGISITLLNIMLIIKGLLLIA